MRRALFLALVCLTVLPARPPKPAEAEAQARVVATVLKALPPPPPGWVDESRDDPHTLQSVASKQEAYVLRFNVNCLWRDPAACARAKRAEGEVAQTLLANHEQDQQIVEAVQKEQEALARRVAEALQRGNQAEAQRLMAEMETLHRTKVEPIHQATNTRLRERMRRVCLHDGELSIAFNFNEAEIGLGTVKRQATPAEGIQVFREEGQENDQGQWMEGTTYAFVGAWKAAASSMKAPVSLKAGYLKPQSLMVRLTGDEARVRQVMSGMDWKALKALLAP